MRKVKLQLDELAVESFDTAAVEKPGGTVHAHERTDGCTNTCPASCFITACSCPEYGTCAVSCPNGTCWLSCDGGYSCFC